MSKLILPGLIDPHVHLRDPGQTHKEDFYTGTCAALAGGFTTILDMPNNKTPITTSEKLNEKIKIAREKIVCDVGFYFGSLGDNTEKFPKVMGKVVGLKLYLNQTTGGFIIDKKMLEKILISWNNVQSSPLCSSELLSKPVLVHAEDKMLNIVIELARKLGKKIHVCHISTTEDLKQIIKAKNEGLTITCGVTPHHLFLTENDVKRLGSFGTMKPPLQSKKDQDFLWENLKFIDVIESDHAPHTKDEKESASPPSGVPGLETTLPLLLTAMSRGRITKEEIISKCYKRPKGIFHLPSQLNTYIEVDLDKSYVIKNENLFTKCKWSPFNGWKVRGKVIRVFIRGQKVFENDRILVKPGFGKILTI